MDRPISKHDEYLLSRLLDGDLPEEQAAVLRERIRSEPQLRSAYAALARLDELLTARRSDQPALDLRRFHQNVMICLKRDLAESAARRARVIRLGNWLRLGVPLAAAAAVVLAVSVYFKVFTGLPRSGTDGPIQVAMDYPAVEADAKPPVVVVFHRPPAERTRVKVAVGDVTPVTIKVAYNRSAELAGEMSKRDEMAQNMPSLRLFRASLTTPTPPVPDGDFFAELSSL